MAEKNDKGGEKPQEKKGAHSFNRNTQSAAEEKPVYKRPQAPMKTVVSASGKEVRGIVRLAGCDLRGSLPIRRAITSVKGIGINLGKVVSEIACQQLGMNDTTMIGELSEQEVDKLEHIMRNPTEFGVPVRMLNRQKDIFSGNDIHLIGSDLTYMVKLDIDHDKDSYSWKGYRHSYGQKVRGQRTRSTGRTGMTVGVLRKAVLAKAGAGAPTAGAAQAASAPGAAPAAGAKVPSGAKPPTGGAAPKAAPAAKAAPAKKEEAKK